MIKAFALPTSLGELATRVEGEVLGDPTVKIRGVASIEEAGPGDLTFLGHPKYHRYLVGCRAAAVVIGRDSTIDPADYRYTNFLRVRDAYYAFGQIQQSLIPPAQYNADISERSTIEPSAALGKDITVYPNVYIGRQVRVGRRCVLMPGVFLGDGVVVGDECVLHPNVTIEQGCRIGSRVILHAGVVIGSDGFGYAGSGKDRIKVPQTGSVEVADDVEIGANTTVDRATLGHTRIGRGTKIDNLVHIGHNVTVGENSLIIAQVGVAGSTKIGNNVILAGQSGVRNHVEIGDGCIVGPRSGIAGSLPSGSIVSGGVAALPHSQWLRVLRLLPRLPRLWNTVLDIERRTRHLGKRAKEGE